MTRAMMVLLRAWGLLIGLSLVTLLIGGHGLSAGLAGTVVLLGITLAKGRQILIHYMELHRARRGWRVGLTAYLAVVCVSILAAQAAGALGSVKDASTIRTGDAVNRSMSR